jgi:DNA-binding transcriptional ArsR family regulator
MDAFYALAEPRRRRIVEILANRGQMSATEISKKFDITAQAISQHLKVLLDAKLLVMRKQAQRHIYRINPASILEIEEWAKKMESNLNESLDKLDLALQVEKSVKKTVK